MRLLTRSIPVIFALAILACFCSSAVQTRLTRREPQVTNIVAYVELAPSSLTADYDSSDEQEIPRIKPVEWTLLDDLPYPVKVGPLEDVSIP